jgi:hypothetical protein
MGVSGCAGGTCADYEVALEGCMMKMGAPSALPDGYVSTCQGSLQRPSDFAYYQCLTGVYAQECLDTPEDQRIRVVSEAVVDCGERTGRFTPITLREALADPWGR